ncbi:hypothetical protein [Celeribacter arenosi]|uniref:Uncharacterized protein n=1 Tax=Celeribacter arenosi TaxID=792649 RepID=A0ABP7KDW8_9RHOB
MHILPMRLPSPPEIPKYGFAAEREIYRERLRQIERDRKPWWHVARRAPRGIQVGRQVCTD